MSDPASEWANDHAPRSARDEGWKVVGPDGQTYRVERVTYEADDEGQIGNTLVRRTVPVLRCIPSNRCPRCNGSGRVTDWRPVQGPFIPRQYDTYPKGRGFAPQHSCRWCEGCGSFDDVDDFTAWPVIMALLGGMDVDDCMEEARRW